MSEVLGNVVPHEYAVRKYTVVSMLRNEEVIKLYITPGMSFKFRVAPYIDEGWLVYGVTKCNREEYLNARIDDLMEDYNYANKGIEDIRKKFEANKVSFDSYMVARKIYNELVESYHRRLHSLMHRLWNEDLDCYNEEATQVYNMVF